MYSKTVSGIMLLSLIVVSILVLTFNIQPAITEHNTIIVPDDYPTIQEAVNSANSGDIIFVKAGVYYENVVVNKSVSLIGENINTTIIDGKGNGNVLEITACNVSITGFTIRNSARTDLLDLPNRGCGIKVLTIYNNIRGNFITNTTAGIYCSSEQYTLKHNIFSKNTIHACKFGIYFSCSYYSTISDNLIISRSYAIYGGGAYNEIGRNKILSAWKGISLWFPRNCTIRDNRILNVSHAIELIQGIKNVIEGNLIHCRQSVHDVGIDLCLSNHTIIRGNIIVDSGRGLFLDRSSNNAVFHNNFLNNMKQVRTYSSINNTFDNGYPSGGNYWSNYVGIDVNSGLFQNMTSSDGIGDTPYVIDEDNVDNYPLMAPFSSFAVCWNETSYQVDFVSNSTISNHNFNGTEKLLSFNVEGPDNTLGICRVTIPKSLMKPSSSEDWQITVDGHPPLLTNIIEGENETYLYFTYRHSIHEIKIKIVTQKTLLGTGWGWMRISPKQYVYGPAKLYKIGESQIELIITHQGEDYSRTWNIIWHKEYKNQEIYYCFNPEYGPLMVVIYELKWSFWSAVGKDTVAFKFPAGFGFPRFKIYPI